jgi:hypothetical protein
VSPTRGARPQGCSQAELELDPESVTRSVGLLSLKGGMPPDRLALLQRLVERIVRDLVRELTSSLRPALTGGGVARPARRLGGPLDLSRTVARSLCTARFRKDGTPRLVPDRLAGPVSRRGGVPSRLPSTEAAPIRSPSPR